MLFKRDNMNYTLNIQNLKCGGCAATITKSLSTIDGVSEVKVDNENENVSFQTDNETLVQKVKSTLQKLGYPSTDEENTILAKAKSYVSCAIGRIDNM